MIIIVTGFYLLVNPYPVEKTVDETKIPDQIIISTSLTIRIGSSVLLIFLVGILFRVFKYLLRVAAFYNSKADALEFFIMHPKMELQKLMELFTPDKYDISDLEQTSIATNIADMVKGKLKAWMTSIY